jgi:hypothetical protein
MTSSTELFLSAREAWMYDPKLKPRARIAGLYLARRYELTREWHPRAKDVAAQCGLTEYEARQALEDLKRAGYLTGGKKFRNAQGHWQNSPYRVTEHLRNAALYWRHKSPDVEIRHPETRRPETDATYPQNKNDRPRGVHDQDPLEGKGKGSERRAEGVKVSAPQASRFQAPETKNPLICPLCGRGPFRGAFMRAHMHDAHGVNV